MQVRRRWHIRKKITFIFYFLTHSLVASGFRSLAGREKWDVRVRPFYLALGRGAEKASRGTDVQECSVLLVCVCTCAGVRAHSQVYIQSQAAMCWMWGYMFSPICKVQERKLHFHTPSHTQPIISFIFTCGIIYANNSTASQLQRHNLCLSMSARIQLFLLYEQVYPVPLQLVLRLRFMMLLQFEIAP